MAKKVKQKLPAKSAEKEKRPRTEKQIAAQFKKGTVNNPLGGKAHDPFVREVRAMTNETIATAIKLTYQSTPAEVAIKLSDPNITLLQKTILRAALDAAENGNFTKFNVILERVVGKVPEVIHISSPDGSMSPIKQASISDAELEERIMATRDKLNSLEP